MTTFNVGDRVMTIQNSEIRKGTVKIIFENFPDQLVVEFDDGEFKKTSIDKVALEPKSDTNDKQNAEPVEKSEITITPDEFRDVGIKVITKATKRPLVTIVLTAFLADLHKALFFGEVSENS